MKALTEFQIQTGSNFFDYEEPEKSTMTLEDVAHAISNICRWGGHCDPWFSVGQHVCFVYDLVVASSDDPVVALIALHHDDHESLRGDIPTPRKGYLKKHNMLYPGEEVAQDTWIYTTLVGINYPFDPELKIPVKRADKKALETERRYLKPRGIQWYNDGDYKDPLTFEIFEPYLQDLDWKQEYLKRHEEAKGKL